MSHQRFSGYFLRENATAFNKLVREIETSLNNKSYKFNNKPVIFSVEPKDSFWGNTKEIEISAYQSVIDYGFNIRIDFDHKKRCKVRINRGVSETSVGYIEGISLDYYYSIRFKIRIGSRLKTYVSESFTLESPSTPCSDVRYSPEQRRLDREKLRVEQAEKTRLKLESLKLKVVTNHLNQSIGVDTAVLVSCGSTKKIEYGIVTEMLDRGFKFVIPESKTYTCRNINLAYAPDNKELIEEIQNAVTIGILTNA